MIDVGNIVGIVLENAAKVIPGRMIEESHRGVRLTNGVARRAQLEPGWYWFIPLYQSIKIVSVKDQVKDIPIQSMTTKDDRTVSASLCVEYEVFDAVRWQIDVHNFDDSLNALAKIYVARGIRAREYHDVRRRQRRIERSIQRALSKHTEAWGVRIKTVGLETFVEAWQGRLMGEAPRAIGP